MSDLAGKGTWCWCWESKMVLHYSLNNASCVRALMEIGANWVLTEETIANVEAIVCKLFGKKCASVDVLRYELQCAREGNV